MKTLCMDTTNKYLVVGLYEDDVLVSGSAKESWKRQSELLLPTLIECMEQAGWESEDLDEVVITDGPGSYTGVRIAMTAAKVLCTQKKLPLYTISALQLYAGLAKDALVVMDARSHRAYAAVVSEGSFLMNPCVLNLEELQGILQENNYRVFGDGELLGRKSQPFDLLENFIALRPMYRLVSQVHTLTPSYLKDQSAYHLEVK